MNLRQEKGITLIALVITIIVMLILVGVTITIAVNGGLFDYAKDAATRTNAAKEYESGLANVEPGLDYDGLINYYSQGNTSTVKTVTVNYKGSTIQGVVITGLTNLAAAEKVFNEAMGETTLKSGDTFICTGFVGEQEKVIFTYDGTRYSWNDAVETMPSEVDCEINLPLAPSPEQDPTPGSY